MSNQERIPCTFPLSSPSSPARPTTEQNPNNSPFRTPDQTTRTIEDNLNSRNLVSHGDSSPEEVSYGSRQRLNLSDSRRRSGEILPDDISISEQETRRYPIQSIQSSSTHRPNDGIASHNQRTNANNPSDYFFPPGLHQQSTSSNAPQHTGLLPTIQRFFSENTEAQTVNQTFHTQHSSSPQSTGTDQMEDFYQNVYQTSITTVLPSGRPIEMSPNYIRSLASNVHVDAPSQHPTSHPFSTDNSVQSNPQMSTSFQSSGITYYQPSVHSQNSAFRPTNTNQTPPGTYRPPPAPGAPLPFFPYVTTHSSLNSQSSPQMSAHGQILAYPSFNQPVVPHPVTKLYEQLVSGCQRSSSASSSNPVLCWNPFCASNPHSVKRSTDEISKLVTLLSGCGFVGDLYCESVKSQILSQTSLEGDRTNSVPQFQGQFVPMSFATTPDISAPNPVPSFLHLDPSSLTACLMTYQDRADLWVNREPINDSIADGLARELVWGRIYSNASMMEVVRLKQCTPDDYILELFDLMASQRTGQTSPSSQPTFLPNHIAGVVYYIFSRLDLLGKTFMVPNPSSIFSHSGGHATQVVNVEKVKLINDWVIEKCPLIVKDAMLLGIFHSLEYLYLGVDVVRENTIRGLFTMLLNPLLSDPRQTTTSYIISQICDLIVSLTSDMKEYLNRLIVAPRWRNRDTVEPKSTGSISAFTRQQQESDSESLKKDFAHFVNLIQSFILNRLIRGYNNETDSEDDEDEEADRFKGRPSSNQNKLNEVYNYLPYTEFQNATLSSCLDIKKDFPKYRTQEFSYCQYPFIITTEVKADILKIECMVTMRHELQDAFFRSMFIGVNSPYCVLKVRREWVVRDAMAQLEQMSSQDLKKQLKVAFIGEAGVDEGGVQKEFFQIVVRDMFDEKYGMFTYNPQARTHWFTPNSVHDELSLNEYKLVGRLIGLAIYNSVLMDVKFPIVLYKKLLLNMNGSNGKQPLSKSQKRAEERKFGLIELSEVDPDLARGLQTLLDYPGDVQELYDRTFEVEYDCLGARLTAELKPGGSKISLTNENRKEFVQLYCDFILNTSIKEQFQSFKDGFDLVTGGSVIYLFRPEELEILVCGSSSLNFEDLEDVTQYDGGYTENTPVIKSFWKIVHSFSVEEKKRLLAFATGSDRSPIGGLSRLQFVIAKNGDDSDRLPTSHTCFNVLLLPEYKSKDKLRERLLTAIQNAEGFGLL